LQEPTLQRRAQAPLARLPQIWQTFNMMTRLTSTATPAFTTVDENDRSAPRVVAANRSCQVRT
jgi:hypothetical protein